MNFRAFGLGESLEVLALSRETSSLNARLLKSEDYHRMIYV